MECDVDIRKDLHANIVLHHSVRVIGKRISENSLHRLPCRPENDDVASAGSCGMLRVPGLSCQATKQDMLVAKLACTAGLSPNLTKQLFQKYCSLSSSFESCWDRAGGSLSPFVAQPKIVPLDHLHVLLRCLVKKKKKKQFNNMLWLEQCANKTRTTLYKVLLLCTIDPIKQRAATNHR